MSAVTSPKPARPARNVKPSGRIIDGRTVIAAHGTRPMPIWGFEFYGQEYSHRIDRQQADATINRLVNHLQAIQPDYSR